MNLVPCLPKARADINLWNRKNKFGGIRRRR